MPLKTPRALGRRNSRRFSRDTEELLEAYLSILLSPVPEVRAAAADGFLKRASADVKQEVLIRLTDRYLGQALDRSAITAGLKSLGAVAVEVVKLRLYLARKPEQRLALVELLGSLCPPNDILVFLILSDIVHGPEEHPTVRETARRITRHCCPELTVADPGELPAANAVAVAPDRPPRRRQPRRRSVSCGDGSSE